MYEPTWKEYEKDLHSPDTATQRKAADAFDITRKKETTISKKARDWEADRKKEWARAKPAYMKQVNEKEKKESQAILSKFKKLGRHKHNVKPMPGYVLVEPIYESEVELSSGIILVNDTAIERTNIAKVLSVGGDIVIGKHIVKCPTEAGKTILHKHGAGADIDVGEKHLKLMLFSDLLAEYA